MSLKSAIYAELTGDTDVTDVVSARIYPGSVPTGTAFPHIAYSVVGTTRAPHTTASSGLVGARVQFDCFDDDSVNCESVAEALRGAFDGWTDATMGSGDNTADVRSVTLEQQFDRYVEPQDGTERGTYQVTLEFLFWYRESIPTFA